MSDRVQELAAWKIGDEGWTWGMTRPYRVKLREAHVPGWWYCSWGCPRHHSSFELVAESALHRDPHACWQAAVRVAEIVAESAQRELARTRANYASWQKRQS